MGARVDLAGQRFGRLMVLEECGRKNGGVVWRCQCDCGNITEVRSNHLRKGAVVSCGCYNREVISVHDQTHTRLYRIWRCMRERCNNPASQEAERYGGRGIKVCKEWDDFEKFYEWAYANGYEEKAKRGDCTLDRIDNDGDYEPSNCRWADMKVQGRNRRNNRMLTFGGETHCMTEWAEMLGIKPSTISTRLRRGWSVEDALCRAVY